MPLVVPGLMSSLSDNEQTAEWQTKLMGKKIGDASDAQTFHRKDLPKEHRIIEPNGIITADYKPERMNIHLGHDGTVSKITHG